MADVLAVATWLYLDPTAGDSFTHGPDGLDGNILCSNQSSLLGWWCSINPRQGEAPGGSSPPGFSPMAASYSSRRALGMRPSFLKVAGNWPVRSVCGWTTVSEGCFVVLVAAFGSVSRLNGVATKRCTAWPPLARDLFKPEMFRIRIKIRIRIRFGFRVGNSEAMPTAHS